MRGAALGFVVPLCGGICILDVLIVRADVQFASMFFELREEILFVM